MTPSPEQIEAADKATDGKIPLILLVQALIAAEQAEPAPAARSGAVKRDFELIADAIKAEADVWRGQGYGRTRLRALESLANRLSNEFQRTNPRFDAARFLRACDVSHDDKSGGADAE